MNIATIQILFFCLVPVGVLLLIKGIKILRKSFAGKVITEFPLTAAPSKFELAEKGIFSIWQKTQSLKLVPALQFKPRIQNTLTDEVIPIEPAGIGPSAAVGTVRRMKMFQFKTGVGNYHIEFTEAPGIENSEMTNADPIAKPGTKGIFFIQIRESQPDYFIPLGVLMIIFSVACIICGFIFGFLADEIFINPAS